ncbi:BTAD domain-containing putative transcriptional regulator [Streptomyces sp. NPDC040750]|uniref:AfsR/SARP family transcriptional regulator n=1 Tax=Streptomyces sp. NPDC040750 TaxID=3154491 RepID=UPI0033C303B3
MAGIGLADSGELEIDLLGPLDIRVLGKPIRITAPRLQAVLGSLVLRADTAVSVQDLAESIWEDSPPSDPANQVAACVSMLRRKFWGSGIARELIHTQPPGYRFSTAGVRLDIHAVEELRVEAKQQLDAGDRTAALASLKKALSFWRGPALAGMERRAWQPEVHRWEEEYVAIRGLCSEIQLGLGLYDELVTELSVFVKQHPTLEQPRAMLMRALAYSGRQADALQLYRGTAEFLLDELGITPGEELNALHQQVLSGALVPPPQVRTAVSVAVEPSASWQAPCQLPGDFAEFIGREEEIAAMRNALLPGPGPVPVVALVGPGGTGKTALAVHAAHEMRSVFSEGQLYVNLRGMSPESVMPEEALARFLRGLGITGPLPETLDERAELFRSMVADRRILIVLDDAGDAQQVLPLLPGTGSSAVVVTSRARLATIPLTCTLELEVLQRHQALQLLGRLVGDDRLAADPDTAAQVVEYCGRLPLAVRIVGAKLNSKPHWSLRRVAARLADERRRLDELAHENLEVRSCLELSHQGISPDARRLFRRLSLITTDFPRWLAAPLMDMPLDAAEDLLEELLDARLLDMTSPSGAAEPRYRMHDLVRIYAVELLVDIEPRQERESTVRRLGITALAMADRAHRTVCGGDFAVVHSLGVRPAAPDDILDLIGDDWRGWYEADRLVLTALCQQLARQGDDELAWDMAATCRCLVSLRFFFEDWRAMHEAALAVTERRGNERGKAVMLLGLGDLHLTRRNYEEALPLLTRALELFREVGDEYGYALALRKVACTDRVQGRYELALERWQEAMTTLEAVDDTEARAQVLRWTGQTLVEMGQANDAIPYLQKAEQLVQGFSGRSGPQVLLSLAELRLVQGDLDEAARQFGEGLTRASRNGDLSARCYALWGLGWIDVLKERTPQAEEHLQEALVLSRDIHDRLLESDILYGLAAARQARGDVPGAAELLETGADLCRAMEAPTRLERFVRALAVLDGPTPQALGTFIL